MLLTFSTGSAVAEIPSGQTIDGIKCEAMEQVAFHIHAHLVVFDHGKPVLVPADVGRPLVANCIYWLHTHTPDGIIHVESPVFRDFTLGNFFDIWGEPLSVTRVASAKIAKGALRVWVNGRPFSGDPRSIPIALHTEVVLEAGPPYTQPAPFTAWGGL
jgi:hypothetical protein